MRNVAAPHSGECRTLSANASLWLWINYSEHWHHWVELLLFMVGIGTDRWLLLILRTCRHSPPPRKQAVFRTIMLVSIPHPLTSTPLLSTHLMFSNHSFYASVLLISICEHLFFPLYHLHLPFFISACLCLPVLCSVSLFPIQSSGKGWLIWSWKVLCNRKQRYSAGLKMNLKHWIIWREKWISAPEAFLAESNLSIMHVNVSICYVCKLIQGNGCSETDAFSHGFKLSVMTHHFFFCFVKWTLFYPVLVFSLNNQL